jgi:acyl carrier protein
VSTLDRIAPRVRSILADVLGVPADAIGTGFSANSQAEWTSLNHLMLISQIESEFGVVFSNQEVLQLTSFDQIVTALGSRTEAGS